VLARAGLFLVEFAASFAVTVSVFAVSAIVESVRYLLAGPGFERRTSCSSFF